MAGDIWAIIHTCTHSEAVNRFHSVTLILFRPWLILPSLPACLRGASQLEVETGILQDQSVRACVCVLVCTSVCVYLLFMYPVVEAAERQPRGSCHGCNIIVAFGVPLQRLLCILRPTCTALNEAVQIIALPRLRLSLLSHRPQLHRPLKQEIR